MRRIWLVLAACSSTPTPPPTPVQPPIKPAPPAVASRGGSCAPDGPACSEGLLCGPLPGGYCTSFCGVTGTTCPDGTCVETARAGEMCLASCTKDADCRTAEHYICDPQWKACVLPGMVAIRPPVCPGVGGRDPAFGASLALTTASSSGIYQFEPSAVVTDDGDIVAIYIARSKMIEGNPLGVARIVAGKAIDTPFTTDRQSHFDPWLAQGAKGTLYAVWLGFDGRSKNQQIGFATSSDHGATWSKPVPVHADGDCKDGDMDCLDKPMIAIGPDPAHKGGELVHVMYAANEGLRVRTSHDGGKTFGAAVTSLEGIYGNAVVGRDGRVHIATLNGGPMGAFGSPEQKVEYTVSRDGGATFAKPVTASGEGESVPFFFSNPSVAVDDKRGWIYVAYARGKPDGVWDIAVAASKDGVTWKRARIGDDPACAIHMVPNVAVDPTTGTLHVAWYDSSGDHGRFAHATCAAGAATCKDAGAINDVGFAALSTVRHGSKWIGEYESLIVDDKRRVLHAVWSQPVDDGGKVVSRILHASAKLGR